MTVLDITPTDPTSDRPTHDTTTHDTTHDEAVVRARAAFLRQVARGVEPLLARSIRRRAAELELTAWVLAVRDEGHATVP